jgi:hypothetical protein
MAPSTGPSERANRLPTYPSTSARGIPRRQALASFDYRRIRALQGIAPIGEILDELRRVKRETSWLK